MVLRFNIPDDKIDILIEALCSNYAYVEVMPDGTPNSVSKPQFAKETVARFMREQLGLYLTRLEQSNVQSTIATQVTDANITSL